MQGDPKTNNRCPYNQKVEAADRAMWPQARECLGELGEARSEKEGQKAVFSRTQGEHGLPDTQMPSLQNTFLSF